MGNGARLTRMRHQELEGQRGVGEEIHKDNVPIG